MCCGHTAFPVAKSRRILAGSFFSSSETLQEQWMALMGFMCRTMSWVQLKRSRLSNDRNLRTGPQQQRSQLIMVDPWLVDG